MCLPPPSKLQIFWTLCHESSVTDTSLHISIYQPMKSLLVYLVFSSWLTPVLSPTSRAITDLDNAVPIRMASPRFCAHGYQTPCCNFHFLHQPVSDSRALIITSNCMTPKSLLLPHTPAKISHLSSLSSLEFYFL